MDEEDVPGGVEKVETDAQSFRRNRARVQKRFPDQHVALLAGNIVASGSLEEVLELLAEKRIPVSEVLIEYIPG